MTTFYFVLSEIIERVNTKIDNGESSGTKLGDKWSDISSDQKDEIRDFLCDNTEFSLHSLYSNESLSLPNPVYNITVFDSDCTMITEWADDHIRI